MPKPTDTVFMPACPAAERVLGHCALVREMGRGGMSVVYEGRDSRTGRTVAVKALALPTGLPTMQMRERQARFAREAHAVVGLSHPNIVSIYELGEHDGQQFLVMEFLRGETLRQRLVRAPLTPVQALLVLRQVADAVDAIHALGIVHRDIKPSNVMLLPDGTAKLLDFGIARQDDDATITSAGMLVGSPAYMAPEQVRGEEGTPQSDLWALGALLYEMLAGRPPFTGKNIPSVLYQVSHEKPPPIPGLPGRVHRVLRRALLKTPARRYPTARAFAESLAAAVSVSYPPSSRRGGRWIGLAASAGVALGFGVLALRLGYLLGDVLPTPNIVNASDIPSVQPEGEQWGATVTDPIGPRMRSRRVGVVHYKPHRRQPVHRSRKALQVVTRKHFLAHQRAMRHAAVPTYHTAHRRAAYRSYPVFYRSYPVHDQHHPPARPLRTVVFRHPIAVTPHRLNVVVWHSPAVKPTETDAPQTRRSPDKLFDPAKFARLQKSVWPVGR